MLRALTKLVPLTAKSLEDGFLAPVPGDTTRYIQCYCFTVYFEQKVLI